MDSNLRRREGTTWHRGGMSETGPLLATVKAPQGNLLVSDMQAGPLTSYANALWADSLGAYSGPLHVCDGAGVRW